ncbi:hypothetical protein GLYMA_02G216275v4 [Glycine max]|nr:hypothetical protein GLYMA_02G216275v4 [Glycine max]KAH1061482.1 hypothetical protein GYH30_004798 [Glycine max]
MLRNSTGFYSYAIFEHLKEWPAFNIPQIRIVYKLRKDKFHYMAVSNNRHRFMPLPMIDRGKEEKNKFPRRLFCSSILWNQSLRERWMTSTNTQVRSKILWFTGG